MQKETPRLFDDTGLHAYFYGLSIINRLSD